MKLESQSLLKVTHNEQVRTTDSFSDKVFNRSK